MYFKKYVITEVFLMDPKVSTYVHCICWSLLTAYLKADNEVEKKKNDRERKNRLVVSVLVVDIFPVIIKLFFFFSWQLSLKQDTEQVLFSTRPAIQTYWSLPV